MNEKYRYLMALSLIKGVGPIRSKTLIAHLGSAEAVFHENVHSLLKIPGVGSALAEGVSDKSIMKRVDAELEFIDRYGIEPLAFDDARFPVRLQRCDDSPIVVFTKGNVDFNVPKVLSVVGTRRPTDYGRELCERMISDLAQRHPSLVVVSGLAYGIDVCSHKAALKAGLATVGVVAHGLDTIYPAAHRNVAAQMVERGALLTEYMSATRPDAPNFVQRNRIVAGVADATLVMESGRKGGSLITAHLAQGYNRDVMAVPGAPWQETSGGCNDLIKRSVAALVESADDIEYVTGWQPDGAHQQPLQGRLFAEPATDDERLVYNTLIAEGELTASMLSIKCSMPMAKLNAMLLEMEFSGLVKALPGNAYRAVK